MIPGMGSNILDKNNEQASIDRIKRFLYILGITDYYIYIDSMTESEL
jgi:hypothetical protein